MSRSAATLLRRKAETRASKEPHNLVERVFGSKVTGAGGDAIPLR